MHRRTDWRAGMPVPPLPLPQSPAHRHYRACSGYKIESSLQAHPGGFSALDAQGELVATAGYVNRMGRLALDTYAKVGGLWRGCREGWLVGEPTGREGGSEYSRGSV